MYNQYVKFFIIILILLISPVVKKANGQSIFEDKQKGIIVKNKIHSIVSWDYNFVDGKFEKSGQKTSLTKYDDYGNIIETVTYKLKDTLSFETYRYDKYGNRIDYTKKKGVKVAYQKSSKFNSQNKLLSEEGFVGTSKFKNTYEYNDNGKLSLITYTLDNKITEKRVFENKGNLSDISVYNANGGLKSLLSLKYDDKGNIIEEIIFDVSKKPLEKKIYVYNSNNQVISEVKYRADVFYYKQTYLYNSKNELTNIDEENPSEKRFLKKQFTYDTNGNLIEMKWRRNSEEKFSTRTYTYDSISNCTEYVTFYPATNFKVLTKLVFE